MYEPATAKNILAVNAAANGNSSDMGGFNQRGPTAENVTAPQIVAPGIGICKAQADGIQGSLDNGTECGRVGTSFSTPIAAATAALVEQYFKEGFYPNGTKTAADGFAPSGPLKKAILVNSAWDQYPGSNVAGPIIDQSQGWGKIKLDDALYFSGDPKGLWVMDGYNPPTKVDLFTGKSALYSFHVDAGQPLEVTMAWNDPAAAGIINDLDLRVTAPDGTVYKGNHYKGGKSAAGGEADSNNPLESVFLPTPAPGLYLVNVTAVNLGQGPTQSFAVAVTGSVRTTRNGLLAFNASVYGPQETARVVVTDPDFTTAGPVTLLVRSDREPVGEMFTLPSAGGIERSVAVRLTDGPSSSGDRSLAVSPTDTLVATYTDAGTDSGSAEERDATAAIDGVPPVVSNMTFVEVTADSAIARWSTDEPASSILRYGPTAPPLGTHPDPTLTMEHEVALAGLSPASTYLVAVESKDLHGTSGTDDNGSAYYRFTTALAGVRPGIGYVGWALEGQDFNHFESADIEVGRYGAKLRIGGAALNVSSLPDNAQVVSAVLRIYGKEDTQVAPGTGAWWVEMLGEEAGERFDGTTLHPSFAELDTAPSAGNLSPVLSGADLAGAKDRWFGFELDPAQRAMVTTAVAANGMVAFRLRGPAAGEFLYTFESGNNASLPGGLGPAFAPQLVVRARLAPVAVPGQDLIEGTEDTPLIVELTRTVIDDGPIVFSVLESPENITAVHEGGRITASPTPNWNGDDRLRVRAVDAENQSVEVTLVLRIAAVNDAPRFISVGGEPASSGMAVATVEGTPREVPILVEDPDLTREGDTLVVASDSAMFPLGAGGNLSLAATADEVGDHALVLSATDHAVTTNLSVVLRVRNREDPPVAVINAPANGMSVPKGTSIEFNGSGSTDPDLRFGDSLTYLWTSNLTGVVSSAIVFVETLATGRHRITLTVNDSTGLSSRSTVDVVVCCADEPGRPLRPPPDGLARGTEFLAWLALLVLAAAAAGIAAVWAARREMAAGRATSDHEETAPPSHRPPRAGRRKRPG